MPVSFTLNGRPMTLDVAPDTPLLWVVRESAGLTGTKFGCGKGLCGACTVHVDGAAQRSCQLSLESVAGKSVTTIEGITILESASAKAAVAVRAAWREREVPQCGYCQSGQIMSAVDLLTRNRNPSDADIDAAMSGNLCRCATYQRIRAAIHDAARRMEA